MQNNNTQIKSKKILHLYTSWTKGGAEKRMIDLAKGLQNQGIENIIGAPRDSYVYKLAKQAGLKSYHILIRGSFAPVGIWQLCKTVKKENVDIIHAHQGKVFWPCIFIKWFFKSKKIKVVFHRRAQNPHRFYSRSHYRFADKTIAISNAVAQGLIEREKVPPEKIEVIYNGIDYSVFNESVSRNHVREKYHLDNYIVIGTAASINPPEGKGHRYLLHAADKLKEKYPNARYLIVGTGPMQNYFQQLAQELGLKDKVIFTGYHEDIQNYLAAMDIFCLLSWESEGFGQVMIEAQAMGKTVIGTEVGGIPETFINGKTGILIQKNNVESLTEALDLLLSDEIKRKNMSRNAIEFIKSNFSFEKNLKEIIELYANLYNPNRI